MPLLDLINRPCFILRREETTGVGAYGQEIPLEVLEESRWELQQRRRTERAADGEVSETDWVAFFLPGTRIDTGDVVIDGIDEKRYEVLGDPEAKRNPRTGEMEQVEASLRRTAPELAQS